jgi:hypothetical protein
MALPDYLKKQGLEMQQTEYPPDTQNVNDPPRTPKPPIFWLVLGLIAVYFVFK